MPILPLRQLGVKGIRPDSPLYDLSPNELTSCVNMRIQDGQLKRSKGWTTLVDLTVNFTAEFGTFIYPFVAASYFSSVDNGLVIIAGDSLSDSTDVKFFKYDGSSVIDISPLVGVTGKEWQVSAINDGFLFNNGLVAPFKWKVGDANLTELDNWPTGYLVKFITKYKEFYVGCNTSESGVNFKSKVIWSGIVNPDSGSSDWDFANTTSLAGFNFISDDEQGINTAQELNDQLFLYQGKNVTAMQFTGDQFVFNFRSVFDDGGAAGALSAVVLENTQMALSSDDLYVHDGNTKKSISVNRVRDFLFSNIKSVIDVAFFADRITNEIFIAYRTVGNDYFDGALVYAYDYDAFTVIDFPNISYITEGVEVDPTPFTWDIVEELYTTISLKWSDTAGDANKRFIYGAAPEASKIYILDNSYSHDGEEYTSLIRRDGLDLDEVAQKSFGVKSLIKCYPQFSGEGEVSLRFGGTSVPNGPISLEPAQKFVVGTDFFVDARTTQRYLTFEFTMVGGSDWEVTGMDLELVTSGKR